MNGQISLAKPFSRKGPFYLFSFLFLISICKAQNTSVNVISYPQGFPKEIAGDIQSLLQTSTGQHWDTTQKTSTKGFVLSLKLSGNYKTGESCLINSDGVSYVYFESPTTNGLVYGAYKYLRDLGFKFYLPDSLYTIVPSLRSVFRKTSAMETPFLRIRDFFGTGGFGSGKTDPDHSVQKAWLLWKSRNGFGSEFVLGGHAGEAFNGQNVKELEKHADWTATPIMKNGRMNPSTKLNYYNESAVDFFTDWAIKKFTNKNYQAPPAYLRDMASVDPADGEGYITTAPKGSQLKTISDQVFYAANVAAQKLDKIFPDQPNIGVNLYAYSVHADIPNFSLNPRVFVQVIPYAFQNVAFGPAFINRWSKKVKRFGLYDYFKYPDATWDMPGGYQIEELMKRAIYAANAGSEGTTYESSYSKFSTAIPLWVLCQYMCTGDTAWQKNYDKLIADLYGSAAPAIKEVFDIFYKRAQFGFFDFYEALHHVQKAQQLTTDQQALSRINEIKLYLCYAYLYLKSQDIETGNLEQRQLSLEKIAWTLYKRKIIHSYRIMQLVAYNFVNARPSDKALATHYQKLHLMTFPESPDPDALWKHDYSYSSTDVDNMLNQMFASKKEAARSPTVPGISEQVMMVNPDYQADQNIMFQGNDRSRGYFYLFSKKPETVTISWSLTNSKGDVPTATISGADKSYRSVYDYPLKSSTGKVSIPIPAGESSFFINASTNTTYTLQVQPGAAFSYFEPSPWGKMIFLNEKGTPSYNPPNFPTYIYVPKGINQVQYKVQGNFLKIVAPDGNPVTTNLDKQLSGGIQLRSFAVPPNFSGKFWQAIIPGIYFYQFLNIPDRYFLLEKK
jgi:hypothetical protein